MRICIRAAAILATVALVACGGSKDNKKKGDSPQKDEAKPAKVQGPNAKVAQPSEASSGLLAGGSVKRKAGPMAGGILGGAPSGILGGLVGKSTGTAMSKVDLSDLFNKSKNPTAPAPQISVTSKAPAAVAKASKGSTAALWQLAPDNAAFGFVINDGAFVQLAAATKDIERMLTKFGGPGEQVLAEIRKNLKGKFAPFRLAAWAQKAGVDINKGMAIFMATNGEAVVVLPIVDPAAFSKAVNDTKGNIGPKHCISQSPGRYVCSEKLAYAKAAIASTSPPIATRTAKLPRWLRGDVELVTHIGSFPGAVRKLQSWRPAMSNFGTLAVAARMKNGKLGVHGWLEGKRGGPVGSAFAAIPAANLPKLAYGAVSWMHMRLPMGLFTAKMPPSLPMGSSDLRKDLVDNLTGEALLFTRGKDLFAEHILLTVRDGRLASRAINALCKVIKDKGALDDVVAKPGSCAGKLDLGSLLAAERSLAPFIKGMPSQSVRIAAVGGVVALTLGEITPIKKAKRTHGDPGLAREYLTGNWNLFHWGMAFDPMAIAPAVVRRRIKRHILDNLKPKQLAGLNLLRWLYGHVYEAGAALALRADGVYGLAQVTTFAVDDAATYQAYETALMALIKGDRKQARPAYMALTSAPKTLAGLHAQKLRSGVPMTGQFGTAGLVALATWMLSETRKKATTKSAPPAMPQP